MVDAWRRLDAGEPLAERLLRASRRPRRRRRGTAVRPRVVVAVEPCPAAGRPARRPRRPQPIAALRALWEAYRPLVRRLPRARPRSRPASALPSASERAMTAACAPTSRAGCAGSITSGSRSPTARACARGSGCRTTPSTIPCRPSSSTCPYRKGDAHRPDDAVRHPYFAGHGYAAVRVDIRGSGDSEGGCSTTSTAAGARRRLEVLRWIAAQPWCTGAIGMMGISWGGFNSLQVAARRPPRAEGDHHAPARPTTAMPTTCTTSAARCSPSTCGLGLGHARLRRPPARPGRSSASAGARCGWSGCDAHAVPGRDAGWSTSAATSTGSRARSARTTAPIDVRGLRRGRLDGRLHQRRSSACWTGSRARARALIGPWEHMWPEEGDPGAARSGSSRRRCAGGTTG